MDVQNKISKQVFTTREKSCFLKRIDAHVDIVWMRIRESHN